MDQELGEPPHGAACFVQPPPALFVEPATAEPRTEKEGGGSAHEDGCRMVPLATRGANGQERHRPLARGPHRSSRPRARGRSAWDARPEGARAGFRATPPTRPARGPGVGREPGATERIARTGEPSPASPRHEPATPASIWSQSLCGSGIGQGPGRRSLAQRRHRDPSTTRVSAGADPERRRARSAPPVSITTTRSPAMRRSERTRAPFTCLRRSRRAWRVRPAATASPPASSSRPRASPRDRGGTARRSPGRLRAKARPSRSPVISNATAWGPATRTRAR